MNLDPKVQRIIDWRESIATLADERFFELVRMYLGEVKTPFNKHKLIEELGSFIKKEENNKFIIKLLDKDDLKIVCAIFYMPLLTLQKLEKFFYKTYSYSFLYEKIANLEERLIVFTKQDEKLNKKVLCINPLLEDSIKPFASIKLLFSPCHVEESIDSDSKNLFLSPTIIASFVSYIISSPDISKANGSFKKKSAEELEKIFGSTVPLVPLFAALKNLSILQEAENNFFVDLELFKSFAELNTLCQYMYLCAASVGHFSRGVLQTNAQLLYNTLCQMDTNALQKESILQLSFLLKEKSSSGSDSSQGRFARMLERKKLEENNLPTSCESSDSGIMDFMLDTCLAFGILKEHKVFSKDNTEQEVLTLSKPFLQFLKEPIKSQTDSNTSSLLSVDSAFSVTILPGLLLKDLIPLITFLKVIRCDTVALFEISKQSVMKSFDKGVEPNQILELLQKYSSYKLSQNLTVSVQEWYKSYCSATLYKGYVLKVAEDKIVFVEKNPIISKYIKTVLAKGIYLLSFSCDEEAKTAIKKCGLDFIGNIKNEEQEKIQLTPLPRLKIESKNIFFSNKEVSFSFCNQEECLQEIKTALYNLNLPEEQQAGLLDRINRRIIVNKSQLCGESVRFEKLEATGMDYTGKIHVIDNAIQKKTLLEVQIEGEQEVFLGTPLTLDKKENDAELTLLLTPNEMQETISVKKFSVAKASRIKKIRKSLT